MALLLTVPSSRILTRGASKKTTGYPGRAAGSANAGLRPAPRPVTLLIRSGEISVP